MYYFPFLTFAFTDSTDAGRTDDEEDDEFSREGSLSLLDDVTVSA